MAAKKPFRKTKDPVDSQPQLLPWWQNIIWFFIILALSLYWLSPGQIQPQKLSYSEFKDKVRANEIERVTLQGDQVSGSLRPLNISQTATEKKAPLGFVTTLPPVDDPELISLLEQHRVKIYATSKQVNWLIQLFIGLLPWLLIIGLFWYSSSKMRKRMSDTGDPWGIFGFGRSRAKRFHKGESEFTFENVAGLANAKQDLQEITGYLKNPDHYRKLGAKVPKGILLMGPPGTGKTLLAKAVAGEAEVPFFSISGSEFIEMFVGVGASRVRDMFKSAKQEAPAIIFIDEIDSVGRARGTGLGGGHDEREQTLNQILGEMDGFDLHEAVVVLAATNRPDVLDPALLRPGRFDRKITLDLPDKNSRRAIMDIHAKDVPLADDADLNRLAALTIGFSGADLENLINEAALLSGRKNKENVNMAELLNARDKIVLGSKREMIITEQEKKLIAYHEAGHALAASLLPNADPLDKVTIIPRGRALGATEQIPKEEHYNLQKSYLHDRIGVMLGGRLSEQMIFGEFSSGAEDDLKQATILARHMVTHWGMSEKLGPVAFHRGEEHIFLGREMAQQRDFSEHTAQIIDDEICNLVKSIEKEVTKLFKEQKQLLKNLAGALLEKETLESGDIQLIIDKEKISADSET